MKGSLKTRRRADHLFAAVGLAVMLAATLVLAVLVVTLFWQGASRLSTEFVLSYPSRFPARAGIWAAWVGTLAVICVTAAATIPLGVAAAVYLEEYAPKNWLTEAIEINIGNLAGIPSIVYGLLGLGLFVYEFQLGHSVLAAGLTLALLILPMVIIAAREAIRTVPGTIREAAAALGASRWRTVRDHIVPYSIGGIMTGLILALSRAIGETAPLVTIGAVSFVAFLPRSPIQSDPPYLSLEWLSDPFSVLPLQMFNWISRPQEAFHENAAAAGLVLMALTLAINGLAIYVRARFRRRIQW